MRVQVNTHQERWGEYWLIDPSSKPLCITETVLHPTLNGKDLTLFYRVKTQASQLTRGLLFLERKKIN